ncbi:major capsid protein [Alcanivorax sp.]|uniref:major capsid protein n=1 Tax=Alcanivorax sp. TaxID=1872427 RepID=UPI000C11F0F1|nr:major capsid protein [Alcanivorax sp.]PHR67267.1 MAG: methyltransferase [Alcanivorax sp.]
MKAATKARLEAIQANGRNLAIVAGTGLMFAGPANAAIDPTEITTEISAQSGLVEIIGAAILVVLAVVAGLSLLRRVVR